MTAFTDLAAITFTAGELAASATATGYEDAQGMLSAINNSLADAKAQLSRLSGVVGAGSNKTKIDAAVSALA